MEDKKVDYLVFESICARFERTIRRLWILCIILIILFAGSVYMFIQYVQEFQKETTTIEAMQDGSELNIVGGGDINYGSESENY